MMKWYDKANAMVEPRPRIKYARLPGHMPLPEENEYNAWYMISEIHGAADGILKGKHVVIKDNIPVSGVPMMSGSSLLRGYVPMIDATVVTRVLDAGGVIAGKATCEDFCFSGSSFSCSTGPVLNPHDTSRVSGGSSSGCAVLVERKAVEMAIGSDQAGSIRLPAAWCGVVGMKPTFGLVPYTGAVCIEPTYDCLGPMASTVDECALLLQAISGCDDGMDHRQSEEINVPKYTDILKSTDIQHLKISIVTESLEGCTPEVTDVVNAAFDHFTSLCTTVDSVSVPLHKDALAIWLPIDIEGACKTIIGGAGFGIGHSGFYPTEIMKTLFMNLKATPNDKPVPLKLVSMFSQFIQNNHSHYFYGKCQNLIPVLRAAYDKALKDYDILLMPTVKFIAPKLPHLPMTVEKYLAEALGGNIDNTAPFNATGHPALTLNGGWVKVAKDDGSLVKLPVGIQLVGRRFDDATVLKVAKAFEESKFADTNSTLQMST